jgi:microcystin-dependent protein
MGWLLCDGRALEKSLYPQLFNVIQYNFGGSGDMFNLPNPQSQVIGFIGQTPPGPFIARAMGDTVGEENHTLTTAEMPAHNHTGTTDSAGSHTHTSNAVGVSIGLITSNGENTASGGLDNTEGEPNLYTSPQALTIAPAGDHTHTFTTSFDGEGQPFTNMQPTLFLGNLFVYAGKLLTDPIGTKAPYSTTNKFPYWGGNIA